MSFPAGAIVRKEECGEDTVNISEKSIRTELSCTSDNNRFQTASDSEMDMDRVMAFSDLSDNTRNIWIVTTAALPWRTGTSINPFLRALYFVRRRMRSGRPEKSTGTVTLVIPWLKNKEISMKLYQGVITEKGETGKAQQIQWIKNYAIDQCGMAEEIEHLHISFYDAEYWTSFGSIFPTQDICTLIPDEEADIAILEEPEHLNWFRVPDLGLESVANNQDRNAASSSDNVSTDEEIGDSHGQGSRTFEDIKLGWTRKFRFVVGIIHTNYTAYIKQYGIGTSILGAPAIEAMSSMVVQAYCHKVIRLSDVIPRYAPWKEITENVHGVREDFLLPSNVATTSDDQYAPIYFIGKLLWAKGLDRLLKIQEQYRKVNKNDEYFRIDIYGDGPDRTAIKRAFHGRKSSRESNESKLQYLGYSKSMDGIETVVTCDSYENGANSDVFSLDNSVKDQLKSLSKIELDTSTPEIYKYAQNYINMGFELVVPRNCDTVSIEDIEVMESRQLNVETESSPSRRNLLNVDPFSIISDVSKKTLHTGISTTLAVKNLADSAIKASFDLTFSPEINESQSNDEVSSAKFKFDPPQSICELRRNPIPARFLGVKDHALLKDLPHKIFLNPSVTEVLCTTTAEALCE